MTEGTALYSEAEASAAEAFIGKHSRGVEPEAGAALAVVAALADQVAARAALRDDMIRAAVRQFGASQRQIADAAGLDRSTVARILKADTGTRVAAEKLGGDGSGSAQA